MIDRIRLPRRQHLIFRNPDGRPTKSGVVVLSFWCTTCHNCRHLEEPLAKLAKDHQGQAAVYALAANVEETAQSAAAFLKGKRLELPVVLDPGVAWRAPGQ